MTQQDLAGLLISFTYAFGLLAVAEGIRKWRGWPQDFTRKIVHVGAGLWVWGLLYVFDHWYIGLIPFGSFIILNYLFYRQRTFKAMDAGDSSPGTIYFAVSNTVLLALLWRTGGQPDRAPVAVAAIMAMTLGDAAAAIVGQSWGRRAYHLVRGTSRTWEGSAAMAVFTFAGIAFTLAVLPGSALSPYSTPLQPAAILLQALVAAVVATIAEAASPAGTDNLSVPLLTALALFVCSL